MMMMNDDDDDDDDKLKIKLPLRLTKHYAMETYGEVCIQMRILLTSALFRGEWSASRPSNFTPGEGVPGTLWIGGCRSGRYGEVEALFRTVTSLLSAKISPLLPT
jgi:hypothetical protein